MTGPKYRLYPTAVRLQGPGMASRLQPSSDVFAMDRVPFPRLLRTKIADADLRLERGELTVDDYEVLVDGWIGEAMVAAGLDRADGWMWYPSPPARHNPQGVSGCWWRFR